MAVISPTSRQKRSATLAYIFYLSTWALVTLLLATYISSAGGIRGQFQSLKKAARTSLRHKADRVKLIAKSSGAQDAHEYTDLPFDDVFLDWFSRLAENRHAEYRCLQQGCLPVSLILGALAAVAAAVATVALLGAAVRAALRWRKTLASKPRILNVAAQLAALETPSPSSSTNQVCTVQLWGALPLSFSSPWKVGVVCFFGSIFAYFCNPDDFFFLFIAGGQVMESGSFRSCGPVLMFAALFCFFEAHTAYTRSSNDNTINSQLVTVVRDGCESRVCWSSVHSWELVRLRDGEQPPCDLLLTSTFACTVTAQESGLTGELKGVKKQPVCLPEKAVLVIPTSNDVIAVSVDRKSCPPLLEQNQLFSGTHVSLRATTAEAGFIDGRAIRLACDAKMYRRCEVACQPTSHLSTRMSMVGSALVFVLVLSAYDNTLSVVLTTPEVLGPIACLKVFFGNLLYENTLVPMSLKQVVVVAATVQACWYRLVDVDVNTAWAVIRLGELAVEAPSCTILTDKTGTLTKNTMRTRAVAVKNQSDNEWCVFADSTKGQLVAPTQRHIGLTDGQTALRRSLSAVEAYPFPVAGDPAPCSEAARRMYFNWASCTEELPSAHVCEFSDSEEASFIKAIPGRLTEHLPRDPGTNVDGLISYTVEVNEQQTTEACHMIASLPFSRELRGKGAIVKRDEETFALIVQGASSLIDSLHPDNPAACKTTEEHLLGRIQWHGAVRVWFHAERALTPEEAYSIRDAVEKAASDSEREAALAGAYVGCELTQATAMEDPYQDNVPETLKRLQMAGFKVMMVTGDSESAAEGIAYAIGLADRRDVPCVRITATNIVELRNSLEELHRNLKEPRCLLIGTKVTSLLKTESDTTATSYVASDESSITSMMAAVLSQSKCSAVWAQSSVDQKPFITWFVQTFTGSSALAVGDGVNDIGMIEAAHLGVGIRGNESIQAAKAAGLQIGEWQKLSSLLLTLGTRSMILISVAVKWIYFKHAMTAFALQAWLVHRQHAEWKDPTDPLQMMVFNTVSFGVVIAYSVSDQLSNSYLLSFQQRSRGSLFRVSSLLRWWSTGALYGFLITFSIVLCFPDADEQRFGTTLLCMQCASLSARCWFASNTLGRSLQDALDDSATLHLEWREKIMYWALRTVHSRVGFCMPALFLVRLLTAWAGIEVIPVLLLSAMAAAGTLLLDCLVIPRWGVLRLGVAKGAAAIMRVISRSKGRSTSSRGDSSKGKKRD